MSENNKGFTMVELLTTITIMGILMAVGISAVFIYIEKTRKQAVDTIASTAYDGMIMYMMDNNVLVNQGESYPTSVDSDTKIPRSLGGTKCTGWVDDCPPWNASANGVNASWIDLRIRAVDVAGNAGPYLQINLSKG